MADTHLFEASLLVPEGDVLVHAGDFCRGGELTECRAFAAWWNALPHRHKILVAGNHDWCFSDDRTEAEALFERTHYLQDAEVELGGLRVYGSPWQPEFHQWAFNLPRGAALAARWALIPEGLHLLITHGPPHGTGDRTSYARRAEADGHSGCVDLRRRIEVVRPALHVYGHIHEDGGAWHLGDTWSANVTTWECERPCSVFDIDVARRVATPVVVPSQRPPYV